MCIEESETENFCACMGRERVPSVIRQQSGSNPQSDTGDSWVTIGQSYSQPSLPRRVVVGIK